MGMVMEVGKKVRRGRTRVGWIGIGVMGGAMATRLLAAGFTVTAYARTSVKADALVAAGASVADSPASVAAASDVVFTMGAAGSRFMDIFGTRAVSRDFASGPGSARYIIKDLGMALEIGDGQEEEDEATALPGAALFRQMFSAMVANGDGDLCVRGLITVIERLSGVHK
ncbi:putative oxidoreductase yfjR [Triticum urartu]|uniref:Putative oxidoreductase yfjR n=1 Tax=Triticum urartu TaxID=4572 RepID=M7ZKE2_TRIUA|nr:putative oxidoreductase yfjR [Triticum urartu]